MMSAEDDLGSPLAVTALLTGFEPLPLVCISKWADVPTPQRAWAIEPWLPMMRATFLTGRGGAGKSLLGQQLATCVALGERFIGLPTRQLRALYLTCEDDLSEMHIRQAGICQALGRSERDGEAAMYCLSRFGEMDNLLIEFDGSRYVETPFYRSLLATVKAAGVSLIVLDNVSHLCPGYQLDELAIGTFCNLMDRLAAEICGAVLFIGHPPKSGAEYSGQAMWENRVRSRLFLDFDREAEDAAPSDVRVLKRSKSNYAKTGEEIKLLWSDWSFDTIDDHNAQYYSQLTKTAEANVRQERFLACLDKATEEMRPLSVSPQAGNYAPKVMAGMPAARGMRRGALEEAMNQLLHLGTIVARAELWRGSDRKPVIGLARCGTVRDGSEQVIENNAGRLESEEVRGGCGAVRGGTSQVVENNAGRLRDGSPSEPAAPAEGGAPPKGGRPPSTSPGPTREEGSADDY